MFNEDYLLDSFEKTGVNLDEFKDFVNEVAKTTTFLRCNSKEMKLLSLQGIDEEKERFYTVLVNPNNMMTRNPTLTISRKAQIVRKSKIMRKGNFTNLIDEMQRNTTRLFFYKGYLPDDEEKEGSDGDVDFYWFGNEKPKKNEDDETIIEETNVSNADKDTHNNTLYFVSPNVFSTMDSIGMKGKFLLDACLERDLMIGQRFSRLAKDCTFVVKEVNGMKKIFAMLSGKYNALPQNVLFDVIDKVFENETLGKVVCRSWSVSHFYSCVHLEFPEKAEEFKRLYSLKEDFVPGLILATSDTGDCSFTAIGTWRRGNTLMPNKEIKRRHSGEIDISKVVDEVEHSIYSEYTKLPEALCDLMAIDITDGSWDLSKKFGMAKNRRAINNTIKSVFKQVDLTKAIGKRSKSKLYENLCNEFDSSVAYTAYDIAMAIVSMPERASGIGKTAMKSLEKACGQAIFAKYNYNDGEDVSLLA